MVLKVPSSIIGPPANELAEALESVASDDLQLIAEYDSQSYELLFVADRLHEKHGGLEGIEDEVDSIFNYYHLDFLERDLLDELLWLGEVGTFVTYLDHGIVVRACLDSAGVFIVLDLTASIDDVQITIQNSLYE